MKRPPRLLASAALSAALLPGLLAGCGGSDEPSATAPSAPATSAAPATPAPSPSIETLAPQTASPSAAASTDTGTSGPSTSSAPTASVPPSSTAPGAPNGVESLAADDILARAKAAGRAAQSVHVGGDIAQGSNKIRLDLRTKTTAGTGTITNNAQSIQLRLIESDLFIQGDDSFYRAFAGGAEAAKLLRGKWVKAPKNEQRLTQLVTFFDIPKLIDNVLDPDGAVRKGEETTVDGQRAVTLTSGRGGTLLVALDGEPYPLRISSGQSSTSRGAIDFTEWNEPVEVQAPAASDVIDIARLRGGGN